MLTLRRTLIPIALLVLPAMAWAEDAIPEPLPLDPKHCGPKEISADENGSRVLEVEAGDIQREEGRMVLRSDARVRHGPWRARAESIIVEEVRERAFLSGDIRVSGPGVVMEADEAELDYAQQRVEIEGARFRLSEGGTGRAKKVKSEGGKRITAEDVVYSTCALEDPAWSLEADTIEVDVDERQGEARNAVLRIGDVPVMVMPWIGFPIGAARKSGWLTPEFGTSDDLGYSLDLPYYFNLAPHYDALLSTRYMGRRGLQLRPSGRYRTRHGDGELAAEFLSDNETDDDRYLLHWKHRHSLPSGWDYRVLYTDVSDGEYLEDFQSGIGGLSTTRLRQEASVAWRSLDWDIEAAVQGSDPLKDRDELWDRLPRARVHGILEFADTGVVVEPQLAVDGFRGDLDRLPYQGDRYDAALAVSRPITGPGWQLTPRLQWRHTEYDLHYCRTGEDEMMEPAREGCEFSPADADPDRSIRLDRSPSRTVPTFSLDGSARFERTLDDGALQTLEPRFFYLNRQHRDQGDLPRFDTRIMEPDFDSLFRHDQHSGGDRSEAADQLAVGITTRIVDPVSGYLRLQAQLGRIWYFRAPADDALEGDEAHSVWAGSFEWRPLPQLQLRTAMRYDPGRDGNNTTWASHTVGWKGSSGEHLQLRYIRRDDEMEQASAQLLWPLGDHWKLALRYHYDLREGNDLELLTGLEYQGCCIAVGIGAWKVRKDAGEPGEDEYENRLMIQVRFLGLAGFGRDVISRLNREVEGESEWAY